MTIKKTSDSISHLPPLREEVERELRLRAWKDEEFRQELIADPKGVIERLFPQCFPDGKVPKQVTYKVIEEDQYTHHIVLPMLPDEVTNELSEETQLELMANMGCSDLTFTSVTCVCTNSCSRRCTSDCTQMLCRPRPGEIIRI
jgi:hypothetical protein